MTSRILDDEIELVNPREEAAACTEQIKREPIYLINSYSLQQEHKNKEILWKRFLNQHGYK